MERTSTTRLSTHRATILARLAAAWDKRPDLTLGELLAKATGQQDDDGPMYRLGDVKLAEEIERFVLLGR
jgi:hypothetical protein